MIGFTDKLVEQVSRTALVLAAHGSSTDERCAAPAFRHARAIERLHLFDEVCCIFWKQPPYFRELHEITSANEIIVVPLMTADGYYARTILPRELRTDAAPQGRRVRVTVPIGVMGEMAELVVEQARHAAAIRGLKLMDTRLLVIGHGTQRDPNASGASTHRAVERIESQSLFRSVHAGFLEQNPLIRTAFESIDGHEPVIVVPNLIADGGHAVDDIPMALGASAGTESAQIDSRMVVFAEAVGELAECIDLILNAASSIQRESVLATTGTA